MIEMRILFPAAVCHECIYLDYYWRPLGLITSLNMCGLISKSWTEKEKMYVLRRLLLMTILLILNDSNVDDDDDDYDVWRQSAPAAYSDQVPQEV